MESRVFGVLDVAVPLVFAVQGVASKLGFRDKSQLKMPILVDGSVLRTGRNHSNVWCGANFVEAHMAGFEVWNCDFRGRHRESAGCEM